MQIRVGRSSCYFPGNPAFCGDVDSAREIKKRELSLDICQEYLTALVNSFKITFLCVCNRRNGLIFSKKSFGVWFFLLKAVFFSEKINSILRSVSSCQSFFAWKFTVLFTEHFDCTIQGTIEEKIYQRQTAKQGLSGTVADAKEYVKIEFSREELRVITEYYGGFLFNANILAAFQ